MAMLITLMRALQHSRSFQADLLTQLQEPDLDALCSCCLETVHDNPDTALIMEQLLDRNVQARTMHSIYCTTVSMLSWYSRLQGVCPDHAEALRHREAGTAAFRRRDFLQAAAAYSGLTPIKRILYPAQLLASTLFSIWYRLLACPGRDYHLWFSSCQSCVLQQGISAVATRTSRQASGLAGLYLCYRL